MQAPRLLEVRCRALRGIRRLARVSGLPDALAQLVHNTNELRKGLLAP